MDRRRERFGLWQLVAIYLPRRLALTLHLCTCALVHLCATTTAAVAAAASRPPLADGRHKSAGGESNEAQKYKAHCARLAMCLKQTR